MGDPAGIGPEIIGGAWKALSGHGPRFAVIGDAGVLRGLGLSVQEIDQASEAAAVFTGAIPVIHSAVGVDITPGRPSAGAAKAIIAWIRQATEFCLEGQASGLVTAPIAKASLYSDGFPYPGHTEYLGALTAQAPFEGERGPVMMLAVPGLRTTLATIHKPLADVPAAITLELIVHTGLVTAQAVKRDFGIPSPRIAVAGLNPHAGESGSIGRQEVEIIGPAIAELQRLGVDATGPYPADSLFTEENRPRYDAALCMYHDQALIPVKMLDFWGGVNVTLGLPIVRTSPDHGTGFDIAGTGKARPDSMIAAIHMAQAIADCRAQ